MIEKYLKRIGCICFLSLISVVSKAQTNDSVQLKTVDVSSKRDTYSACTRVIHVMSVDALRTNDKFNISDELATLPGVSQLNTGVAISKPVIRGLYGNRLQTVLFGLRFDNQQWQDEHGMGITSFGVGRIEIIKGPAALLYGSEAVGGVIQIFEEEKGEQDRITGDIQTRFNSNTLGNTTYIGAKGNNGIQNWGVRAGYESQSDYTDGKNTRILNSRFGGYYFKANYGFKKKKWSSQNNYSSSVNNFGFIMSDSLSGKTADKRFSRTMDGPHHTVYLNILSSQNSIELKNSVLKLNVGGQSNIRMEDEGGGEISLNMHLSSAVYNLQWIKSLSQKTQFIISNQGLLQSNINYGKRVIVPDARIIETGVSALLKYHSRHFLIEGGLGGNYRYLKTITTNNFNAPDKEIQPFEKSFPAINAMLGFTDTLSKKLVFKFSGSTGFRSGNMAELSSNGLHEGTFQYEIGNPNLRTENNYYAEMALGYGSDPLYASVTVFNNYFNDYIYLAPTSETFYGIPIYRYYQSAANLYGGEIILSYYPAFLKGLQFQSYFSTVTGMLKDTTRLPYMPANKIHTELSYSFRAFGTFRISHIMISNDYVFHQNHPAVYETATPAYSLFNIAIAASVALRRDNILITLGCNNIFNQYYYDHLSRLKNFGYHNIGRNIVLTVLIPFTIKK